MPNWSPQGGWRIEKELVFAHALQESQFRTDAVSPAGARGLMQVLPSTADLIEKKRGGLPVVRFLEDEALWQALRRHDLPLRHSPRVRVSTSARQQGRVEVGLSWQLREWATHAHEQREPEVNCPRQLAALCQARCELRAWWQGRSLPTSAGFRELVLILGVPAASLYDKLHAARTFGEFWEWVLGTRTSIGPPNTRVPLSEALAWLRAEVRW